MNSTVSEIELLKSNTQAKIIIITHKSPDGDAMGSTLALYHFLKSQNFSPIVITPDPFPSFLNWMPGSSDIVIFNQNISEAQYLLEKAEYLFALDFNAWDRTGKIQDHISKITAKIFLIDHHQQPQLKADFTLSDTSASSTCELIYTFIYKHWNYSGKLTQEAATCLYTGIMTDTGSFRFPSTTAYTHYVVSKLLELPIQHHLVHQHIFDQNSFSRLQLTGFALKNKMMLLKDLPVVIISLSKDDLLEHQYQKGDTEGLVNYGLSIQGIVLSVFLMENEGVIKISFRSKGKVDVNYLAKTYFNGGGHVNAAGGFGLKSLDDTVQKVIQVIQENKHILYE